MNFYQICTEPVSFDPFSIIIIYWVKLFSLIKNVDSFFERKKWNLYVRRFYLK